jgi:hypothetical protein
MTTPTAPVVQPGRAGRTLNLLLILAALVAIGGVAFAVGRTTAPRTAAVAGPGGGTGGGNAGAGNFGGGNFGGGNFGGPRGSGAPGGPGGAFGGRTAGIRGTVTAISPTTITIQIANGATISLAIDGSTTYHREVAGAATDVATGREVIVQLNGRNANGGGPGASPAGASPAATTGTAGDITVVTP